MSSKPASEHTRALNAARDLGMDPADFERASRGLIAQHPTGVIHDERGGAVIDVSRYEFLADDVNPETVNPSLWRQARLNNIHGLFQVDDGMWQARGYDLSNITFIAGDNGWVIIDPLTSEHTARACLQLANEHLGERPVTAVIYTHSHVDHFGGVLGVVSPEQVAAGECRIIAPEGFLHEAVAENVIAGFAMSRRAAYQFGPLLPPGPTGHVDAGLGKGVPYGSPGLLAPTESITHTGEELDIDGVRVVFQMTPEAEAPAEMNFFFPERAGDGMGWLCMAENCTHTMHNLVPIRGAQVRNSLNWAKYIDEARVLFGDKSALSFASHHWPRWGADDVDGFLRRQRDMYRYLHDQTMRHANHGLTPLEIAELVELPDEFRTEGHTTGYYGHLAHNVKAVYQRYLSWYDGNPANLWKLPPTDAGGRYVDLAGGADALLAKARAAFERGDYRWVAELVNHLVFAEPDNAAARELQADTFEQLGYQAESSTFRNAYLQGANELRNPLPPGRPGVRSGFVQAMTLEQLFDAAAVRIRSEDVGGVAVTVAFDVDGEPITVELSNRTLCSRPVVDADADLRVTCTRDELLAVLYGRAEPAALAPDGADPAPLEAILAHLDTFMSAFPIVEP